MKNSTKKILAVILLLSLVLNVAVISLDTFPFLWPKLKTKFFPVETIKMNDNIEDKVVNKSLEMLKVQNTTIWSDPSGFTKTLFDFYNNPHNSDYKEFHYPKAFLYFGLSDYLIAKNDTAKLLIVKKSFDKMLDSDGRPVFKLDKVDQVPFGLTALNLYKVYREQKYLNFCNILYKEINHFTNKEGIIMYRDNDFVQVYDVLGMTIPFLVQYNKVLKKEDALILARKQLEYYVAYGVDKETYLPVHGLNLKSKIKVGPTNWGRGIGWYFIGLSSFHNATGEFKQEFDGLSNTLKDLTDQEGLWSQFPGSTEGFDASSSTMFLYCMNNSETKKETINKFIKHIGKDGSILQTSGDTYGINDYSKSFGRSELSQGMLLLLLKNAK